MHIVARPSAAAACARPRVRASPACVPLPGDRCPVVPSPAAGESDANRSLAPFPARAGSRRRAVSLARHRGRRAGSSRALDRPRDRARPGRPGHTGALRAGHRGGQRAVGAHRYRRGVPAAGGARGSRHDPCDPRRDRLGRAGRDRPGREHAHAQLHARRSTGRGAPARGGEGRRQGGRQLAVGLRHAPPGRFPNQRRRHRRRGDPGTGALALGPGAGQHRGVQHGRRAPLSRGRSQPGLDLLHRRGRRLVQQRPPLPEPGDAAAQGRGPARGAGQLLPVPLCRPQRPPSLRRLDRGRSVPLVAGASARPHRPPGPPRADARTCRRATWSS